MHKEYLNQTLGLTFSLLDKRDTWDRLELDLDLEFRLRLVNKF